VGAPAARRALLGAILGLTGCVSISGPCELRVEDATRVLACQPGGAVLMMPPSILDKLTRKEVPRDPPPYAR
jgi:hypothetical protein